MYPKYHTHYDYCITCYCNEYTAEQVSQNELLLLILHFRYVKRKCTIMFIYSNLAQ